MKDNNNDSDQAVNRIRTPKDGDKEKVSMYIDTWSTADGKRGMRVGYLQCTIWMRDWDKRG